MVTIWHSISCPAVCLLWFWTPAEALTQAIGAESKILIGWLRMVEGAPTYAA